MYSDAAIMHTQVPNIGTERSKGLASNKDSIIQQRTRARAHFTYNDTKIFEGINTRNTISSTLQFTSAIYKHAFGFFRVNAKLVFLAKFMEDIHQFLQVSWRMSHQHYIVSKQHDEQLRTCKTKKKERLTGF